MPGNFASAVQARTDVFDDKQRSEHDFFEYVAKSYKFFLAGDDYQSQAVDDEIAQEAEDRAEEVRQRNQQLQQVCNSSLPHLRSHGYMAVLHPIVMLCLVLS